MVNRKTFLAGAAVSVLALTYFVGPAHADGSSLAGKAPRQSSVVLSGEEMIILLEESQKLNACAEESDGKFRCYDDISVFRAAMGLPPGDAGIQAKDCSSGWFCAWDNANFSGHWMVSVRYEGTHDLSPYRDRANSVWNRHDGPAQLINVRSLQPDETYTMGPGHSTSDLGALSTPWNNKADKVKLCDPTGC